jgi:SRSO17 transposase
MTMTTMTTTKSLIRFLGTRNGQRAVAAFVNVRSTDPALDAQARETALHFCPVRSARNWTVADLIAAAIVVLPSGVYAAR